jgi:predicted dehydrogenase
LRSTATFVALSAASYSKAFGANERVHVALIGLGNMGKTHLTAWRALSHAKLVSVCDIDTHRLAAAMQNAADAKPYGDFRRILDDRSIDAVVIAIPDHWHVPAALMALEAGKHVYVEKPCSHNLREGRALVDAARKHGLRVQHGTQSRSNPFIVSAMQLLQAGVIGDVLVSKAWNVQRRETIGRFHPESPPAGVDYDTWLGPAPAMPYQANRFHYNWHWWYELGTGDIGNDGVHELDIARWGLGVAGLPSRVSASGGKYYFDDDQQFPDTMNGTFEFAHGQYSSAPRQLIFEMRLWTPVSPYNADNGCEFYGTKGRMLLSKNGKFQVVGNDKRVLPIASLPKPKEPRGGVFDHAANFVDAIRNGTPLHAEIEGGHHSTALAHFGNISTRLGRSLSVDVEKELIVGDDEASHLLGREYRRSHWGTPAGLT